MNKTSTTHNSTHKASTSRSPLHKPSTSKSPSHKVSPPKRKVSARKTTARKDNHLVEKHGQWLLARVRERQEVIRTTLEPMRAAVERGAEENARMIALEQALENVATFLTGDLDSISEPTAAELNRWLESTALLVAH